MYYLGEFLLIFGSLFLLFGSFGIFRLPDVYNRLQAGTKCTTLGAFCSILGIGIMEPSWFWKCLIIATFIMVGNPISNHAIGRAAKKSGVPLWDKSVIDKSEEFIECKVEE
jgi:multicomponent Na+:H+ antiporter subunit G